jgi:beta-lactamase regulating signal transducer with metallopeptidase domain
MTAVAFFVTLVVRVTLVLAGGGLVALGMSRASAARRHMIWSGVLAGVLLMPLAIGVGPVWTLPVLPAPPPTVMTVATTPVTVAPEPGVTAGAVSSTTALPPAAIVAFGISDVVDSPVALALGIWLLGASVFACWLLVGLIRLRRLGAQAAPLVDDRWQAELAQARQRLGVSRTVRLLSGVGTPVPLTWGTLRPVILLPDDAGRWATDRVRVVLLHELAHIRRWDCLTQLVGRLARATHWFNPFAWLAVRQLSCERERACDELVLASGTRASDYAEHLLSFARPRGADEWPAAVAMPMARSSQIERRLRSILSPRVPRPPRGFVGSALLTGAMWAAVLAVATVHPVARTSTSPALAADVAASGSLTPAPPVPAAPAAPAAPLAPPPPAAPAAPAAPPAPVAIAAPPAPALAPPAPTARAHPHAHAASRTGSAVADSSVVDRLIAALKAPDADVREEAALSLALVGHGSRVFEALVQAAQDRDARVREKAVLGLALQGGSQAFAPLAAALSDSGPQVREKAAIGLGLLGDPRAIPLLTGATQDADAGVRDQAWRALVALKSGKAESLDLSLVLDKSFGRFIGRTINRAMRSVQPILDACAAGSCPADVHVHVDERDIEQAVQGAVAGSVIGSVVAGIAAGVTQGIASGVAKGLPQALRDLGIDTNASPHPKPRNR